MKTIFLTAFALLAFSGNSILCRLALGDGLIDAAGFTSVRLFSGAITLAIICLMIKNQKITPKQLFKSSTQQIKVEVYLFTYAICFSYAYVILETGTGALILFGSVQLTMFIAGFMAGKRPSFIEWLGLMLSFAGLLYLLLPTWGTPSLFGVVLMSLSGLAWGLYTLTGKSSQNPLLETSRNFMGCLLLIAVLNLLIFQPNMWTSEGVLLAVISGALTSGVGYAIWYMVLPELSIPQAGVLQLLVPILAAVGGVVIMSETLSFRLLISAAWVLGGIYLVIMANKVKPKS